MDLIKETKNTSKKIFDFLEKELNHYRRFFLTYSDKNKDLFNLYKKFLKNGKGIRGSLVFLTNKIFKGKKIDQKNLYFLAGFFEIIHSTLLIHDDIMDQDKYRRGEKTISFYFQEKFKTVSKNFFHLGDSLAINIGDIGFFIGFDFFNKIKVEQKIKEKLFSLLVEDYLKVALAQIDDVYYSQTQIEPKLNDIEKIYLFKTARYTFVLPTLATLILKNNSLYKDKNLIFILEKLGILFQITDDLIGFLSDETGKDIGSDIRENKKTIIRFYLIKELNNNKLKNLFGKENLSKEEVKKIRQFYLQSKTKKIINNLIIQIKKEIVEKLENTRFPKRLNQLIINFINYLIKRKK